MSDSTTTPNLASTFVVVSPALQAAAIPVTDTIWADLDRQFAGFAGHTLISSFSFEDDWPTWEVHPHGDEVVCLLSGKADMVMATGSGEQTVRLDRPGEFLIVPRGTWHTAKVHAPTTMLFITPGEGTENREAPATA